MDLNCISNIILLIMFYFNWFNFPTLKDAIEKEKVEVVKILLDRDELNVNAKSINNEYHSI